MAGIVWLQFRGLLEELQGLFFPRKSNEKKPQRVVYIGIIRSQLQRLAKDWLTFLITALQTIEISQINESRIKGGFELESFSIGGFGL